jgi:hypothetical protein
VHGISESVTNVSHEENFVSILFSEINEKYPLLCTRNCKFATITLQAIKSVLNLSDRAVLYNSGG